MRVLLVNEGGLFWRRGDPETPLFEGLRWGSQLRSWQPVDFNCAYAPGLGGAQRLAWSMLGEDVVDGDVDGDALESDGLLQVGDHSSLDFAGDLVYGLAILDAEGEVEDGGPS